MSKNGPGLNEAAGSGEWKPVLGLSDEADRQAGTTDLPAGTASTRVFAQPEPEELIELTVIVPARDEEDCLWECLHSLASQSEEIFELGKDWELIVVDDHSSDMTAEIARDFAGITVLEAGELKPGWTGKASAGSCLPMRTQCMSRATCAGRFMRR
jgi:cellulose synthase/poly-beta-1,6-N-acetylglucosamine synthase-like glycosyltransferase